MESFRIIEPAKIEAESFRIIAEELEAKDKAVDERYEHIVKRVIHTTADFEYADTLTFSDGVLEAAMSALSSGKCAIVTDTTMALSGINKRAAAKLGAETYCFIADEDVAERARKGGITRSAAAVEKMSAIFHNTGKKVIFVSGNAPTATIEAVELLERGELEIAAVVCVPVGFVNVVYAKELLIERACVPYIVNRGRKGGSNVAAAIVNALLYRALSEKNS